MNIRPRRNRVSASIRNMCQETWLRPQQLIYPMFMVETDAQQSEIHSMPGIFRLGPTAQLKEIETCLKLGIQSIILFPAIPENKKDKTATFSWNKNNFYLTQIQQIKKHFPEICVITDVAMDPYSIDGHDGLVDEDRILNDATLPILAQMAVAQAEAGADIIGPSDMMDGRVAFIREALDKNKFEDVGIMSYTAKYASAFYGPFRDALDSAPKKGDKKTYQMNPANRREASREAQLDILEGADFLMVKPALSYLDIISDVKQMTDLPVAAYNVSGEYAMVKAAAKNGWLDEKKVIHEILTSIARAGADLILTYHAKEWALEQQK